MPARVSAMKATASHADVEYCQVTRERYVQAGRDGGSSAGPQEDGTPEAPWSFVPCAVKTVRVPGRDARPVALPPS